LWKNRDIEESFKNINLDSDPEADDFKNVIFPCPQIHFWWNFDEDPMSSFT